MKSRFLMFFASGLLWTGLALAQININTASQEQLDGLKGIEPAKAKAIVDYRQKNGTFKSVDDLQNVPGIGPTIFKGLRADVTISDASRSPALAAPASAVPAKMNKEVASKPVTPMVVAKPPAAEPAKPASNMASKPAAPAAPAAPAMPGKPVAEGKPAIPAAPAAMDKPAAPANPVVKPAAPAKPAASAKPANPAQAAMVN